MQSASQIFFNLSREPDDRKNAVCYGNIFFVAVIHPDTEKSLRFSVEHWWVQTRFKVVNTAGTAYYHHKSGFIEITHVTQKYNK